jgi:serine/threonine protein kinase
MADPNDDKTILATSTQKPSGPLQLGEADNALPIGTRLGEFELIGLVGVGGFGIVYLAEDHSLGRRVALKEYMPSSLASRSQGSQVNVKSERYVETFEAGRRSFVNEARLLAQFDHPSLVKVYRFWEGNGTAYMVMPFYEGITLKQALKQMPAPPDEAWLKALLTPVLDALEVIHAAQVFHRDIAPDNIMLLEGGRPLLLDFGAARRVITDMTQALTVILKPGYAPVEQYAEMPEMKQGAWTDIYALSAVIYFAIMGKTPPPSVGRIMNDAMVPLAQQAAGRYSDGFLRGVDSGLAVKPAQRPQSIAELRELLGVAHGPTAHTTIQSIMLPPPGKSPAGAASPAPAPAPAAAGPKASLLIGGLLAVAALVGGGYYAMKPNPPPPMVAKVETPPAAVAKPETAPVAPPPTASSEPPPAPPPTTPIKPFSPLDEIDRLFQQRSRDYSVAVEVEQAQVRIGRDRLRFRLRSNKSGYLYVLMVGTDRQHFYKIFPNAVDAKNRIDAGKELSLPRPGWIMVSDGPPGADQFIAIVSEQPRDFSDSGLVAVDPFAEYPFDAAAQLAASQPTGQSPFIGKVKCPDGAATCSDAYGAAVFTIEEVESTAAPARAKPRSSQKARQSAVEEAPAAHASARQNTASLPADGRPPGQSIEDYVRNQTQRPAPPRPPTPAPSRNDYAAPGIPGGSSYPAPGVPRIPGF